METKFTTKSAPDGNVAILTSIEGKLDESFEISSEHNGLPVTTVDLRWFPNPYVKKLVIPASVRYISNTSLDSFSDLESIEVASGNNSMFSKDGVLYEVDVNGPMLSKIPRKMKGEVIVPQGVVGIYDEAFTHGKCEIEKIILPYNIPIQRELISHLSKVASPDLVFVFGKTSSAATVTLGEIKKKFERHWEKKFYNPYAKTGKGDIIGDNVHREPKSLCKIAVEKCEKKADANLRGKRR